MRKRKIDVIDEEKLEPKSVAQKTPKMPIMGVREFTQGSNPDTMLAYAGFKRWCQLNGYQGQKRTSEGWKELLDEFLRSEVH